MHNRGLKISEDEGKELLLLKMFLEKLLKKSNFGASPQLHYSMQIHSQSNFPSFPRPRLVSLTIEKPRLY